MGVLSALIVGPCGGPVLLAVLAFAAQTQDMLLGFLLLWVFGTGMGLPLARSFTELQHRWESPD